MLSNSMSNRYKIQLKNVTTPHNNVLIRSGEAPVVGWSRQMLYSGFNILPRSVIRSANLNGRSDNLDVIRLNSEVLAGRLFAAVL